VLIQLDAALGLTCNNTRVPLVSAVGAAVDMEQVAGGLLGSGVPAPPPPQAISKTQVELKSKGRLAARSTGLTFLDVMRADGTQF
jgi:hypothetical protein